MPSVFFVWNEELVEYIGQHGGTPEEFEEVVQDPFSQVTTSRSTGRPARIGVAADGLTLFRVFEWVDPGQTEIEPITAYEID